MNVQKNKVVWFFGVCVLLFLSIYVARMYFVGAKGECIWAGRVLSDDEKIRAAVHYLLKDYPPAAIRTQTSETSWRNDPPQNPVFYKDLSEFFRLNPDCCTVTKMRNSDEGTPDPIAYVMGTFSGFARINYYVRYLDGGGSPHSALSENSIPISNCGRPTHFNPADPTISERIFGFRITDLDYLNKD